VRTLGDDGRGEQGAQVQYADPVLGPQPDRDTDGEQLQSMQSESVPRLLDPEWAVQDPVMPLDHHRRHGHDPQQCCDAPAGAHATRPEQGRSSESQQLQRQCPVRTVDEAHGRVERAGQRQVAPEVVLGGQIPVVGSEGDQDRVGEQHSGQVRREHPADPLPQPL
jgi:hypothetical protein